MLVSEIINKIESKELSISSLAKMYNVSTRTIQNKIKSLGYSWDSKNACYNYVGNEEEPSNIKFETLFDKKKSAKNPKSNNTSNMKVSEIDRIDILLIGKKINTQRKYRGFYFDTDVLSIIDNVDSGNKSDLINEALRKVFKDKGLI